MQAQRKRQMLQGLHSCRRSNLDWWDQLAPEGTIWLKLLNLMTDVSLGQGEREMMRCRSQGWKLKHCYKKSTTEYQRVSALMRSSFCQALSSVWIWNKWEKNVDFFFIQVLQQVLIWLHLIFFFFFFSRLGKKHVTAYWERHHLEFYKVKKGILWWKHSFHEWPKWRIDRNGSREIFH